MINTSDQNGVIQCYGAAFFNYMETVIKKKPSILDLFGLSKSRFMKYIKYRRKDLYNLVHFKAYTTDKNQRTKDLNRLFRILAFKFMREELHPYFFKNRAIKNPLIFLNKKRLLVKLLSNPEFCNTCIIDT